MLHYIFDFLYANGLDPSIHNLFNYLSVRSALAVILSLLVTIYFGRIVIQFLKKKLVQDRIRDLGLIGQNEKQGTPTMGGVIILLGILIPAFLLCRLNNIYVLILLLSTIWMGLIGFLDDYIKVFKKDKKGLAAKFKIIGQVLLGLIVSLIMFFHPDIVIRENANNSGVKNVTTLSQNIQDEFTQSFLEEAKSLKTTIPFFKNNQLDYQNFVPQKWQTSFLIFLPFLVIDMVIASILMSLGMMMLSPMLISLPFKLLLFVLVDGWAMTVGSLAATYAIS